MCNICSDAYHALCHTPRIPERLKAWDQWECNNCLESHPNIVGSPAVILSNVDYNSESSTVDPFLKPHELDRAPTKLAEDVPFDPSIPDVSNWTTEDVYSYFLEHLPEAAPILKDQVIKKKYCKLPLQKLLYNNIILGFFIKMRETRIYIGRQCT